MLPCGAVKIGEMLFANLTDASSFQPFDFIAVGVLEWFEYRDITGLELVSGVRRKATQDNPILETKFQNFESVMGVEAITQKNARFLVSLFFGLRIEHKFEPLQAEIGIGISLVRIRIMPSWCGKCDPIGSMG